MKTTHLLTVFLLLTLLITSYSESVVAQETFDCESVLDLEQGKITGKKLVDRGYEFCSFKGIPYAKAPVGDLRWRSPKPVEKHEGVFEAHSFGDQCPQNLTSSEAQSGLGTLEASEDCLNLNIWRPTKGSDEPLPVMVWIHGGALVVGANSWDLYRGGIFSARQNVIIVSINYRLGSLGYLAHPALIDKDDGYEGGSAGNYGLLDQIQALKWVSANIDTFGGDKNNVTIFGESAGGWSVSYLLASDLAQSYFHKAIMQSGSSDVVNEEKAAFDIGFKLAEKIGCSEADDVALCMRSAPVSEFIDERPGIRWLWHIAKLGWKSFLSDDGPEFTSVPRVDGIILEDKPIEIFKNKGFVGKPFMAGHTLGDPDFLVEGTTRTAQIFSLQSDVYYYRFDYGDHRLGLIIGGAHGLELPVLFDSGHVFDVVWGMFNLYSDEQVKRAEPLADTMQAYWANFARTGNPNGLSHEGVEMFEWPRFDEQQNAIVFDRPLKSISLRE